MNIPNVTVGMVPVGNEGQSAQHGVGQAANQTQHETKVQTQQNVVSSHHHDVEKLQKSVDDLNKRLEGGSTKVVLDPHTPANKMWLNVVDNVTGQVIEKLPPEGLRRFAETNAISGLKFDVKY